MNINQEKNDVHILKKIENFSIKISELINVDNYEEILYLNKSRLDMIQKFKDKNNKEFQSIISNINNNNHKNIERIETKFRSLKAERGNFIKRFKAYNY